MKVFVLLDLVLDSPENYGLRVYSTRQSAEAAKAKILAECGESDDYFIDIEEREVEA